MRRREGWDGRDDAELAALLGVARVESHARIGSTNDRAAELARAGAPSWTVVVAEEQTRGRGRRGARWVSPARAGLWLSVLVREADAGRPLTLLAGLACAEAIEAVAPDLSVGVKWPNDLMVGERKVGGILCEAVGDAVVVGIGVNVTRPPALDDSDGPDDEHLLLLPTALQVERDKPLSRSDLASFIIDRIRVRLSPSHPVERALAEVRERDVLAGALVESEQSGTGLASGVDDSGALLLTRMDGEEVRVVSGSVRFSSRGA